MRAAKKRRRQEDADNAVKEALEGAKIVDLVVKYGIPDKTLRRKVQRHKQGDKDRRPGPEPVLGTEAEDDLQAWVVGMQQQGLPVSRDMLIIKANEVYRELYGSLRSLGTIGRGWCDRFMGRHPSPSLRMAQVIKRARNSATVDSTRHFFNSLIAVIIQERLDSKRIYNVDETGFAQRSKNNKVVAFTGSKNVWTSTAEANFHLTAVACGSANDDVVPPVFVVPGQRLNKDVMDGVLQCSAKISTAPKGFVNAALFEVWLEHFAASVPEAITRPLLLIHGGCSSHSSPAIAAKAASLRILLLPLPANATHLFQPLDVAVFKPFKTVLKGKIHDFMVSNGKTTINKKEAVGITFVAWEDGVEKRSPNVVSGFVSTGLFPPSLPAMSNRLAHYKAGGIKKGFVSPVWLQVREHVRSEILSLPLVDHGTGKRKKSTVDVNRRLWTADDLNAME